MSSTLFRAKMSEKEALRGETHIYPQESISHNKLKLKFQKGHLLSQR